MSAAVDRAVAERIMGWTLSGNRWLDGAADTGFRTTTWKPSEDRVLVRTALKKWLVLGRTARITESDGGQVEAVLYDENIQTIDGLPVNVGREVKRGVDASLPAAVCSALLS